MEQKQIIGEEQMNIEKLFEEKQKAIGNFAKEIAEREWELMEFNLFVSASGKKHLDMASNSVLQLRQLEKEGKIDLKQFESLAEEY